MTARNRQESAQSVPIPISVIGGDRLSREVVLTIADLTQRAPGLTATTPNARRSGISIRGIGKTSGNDNMEAAVGVIVDDVFLGHVGMTYQDFTDLAQVEVLRGPQGTLLGKNTTLGVIKYTSKVPTFTPEGLVEGEAGLSPGATKVRASYSNALIPDKLAFRVSAFLDKQTGDILNVNSDGGHWHERNRWGGRLQLLLNASDTLTLKLNADAAKTDENSNTKPFMVDPTTLNDGSVRTTTYTTRLSRDYFGGYVPIIGSWSKIDLDMARPVVTENSGVSLIANWTPGAVELTSISAVRWFSFDAKNDSEQTRFAIARSGTLVDTKQYSQEFRLAGKVIPTLDYQVGLYLFKIDTKTTGRSTYGADAGAFYATDAQYRTLNTTAGRTFLRAALGDVFQTNYQDPVSDSQAVFGQVNWAATDRLSVTAGLRYTREQKTNSITRTTTLLSGAPLISTGNATADAIRAAQVGTDYARIDGDKIKNDAVAWLINPSFKLTDAILLYASASSGEKSGAVAFENNGTKRNVLPEKATDYELGIKASLLDRRLTLNVNLYHTKVRDYQNVTSEVDPTSSTGYSSRLGNIPGIKARGVEFDAAFTVDRALTITAGGAYNKATYSDWSTATCPRSYPSSIPICDNTGRQIVGAPKWTGILGFNYVREVAGSGASLHLFGNSSWRSRHNLEQLLSDYGWQKAYTLTDLGIGVIGEVAGLKTELSLVAKNVFDTKYTTSVNDFSNTAPVGYDGIGARRYVAAILRTRF
ncbi:TonB-dependent receptor [Sphingomonas sp. AP4-R1]|uniref:TonB-dependent receptor n=1 Tax=Sphingomonas sp. AP4-R1 TaxID=2735134 RepID=UPI001493769D|nr:TonB-dependent receptor [Sphingomonas sp. AP4-R1]QJU58344.1 TonB-dependent receptor [Sphingomonas sp. AP4-R1]